MNNKEQEFIIKCKMKKRWIPYFLGMLERMEYLGSIGSSQDIVFHSDGDGDFRPNFESNIIIVQEEGGEIYKHKNNINTSYYFDAG